MKEIERRFLVDLKSFRNAFPNVHGSNVIQGYVSIDPCVRVRIMNDVSYLTIKMNYDVATFSCDEFEYVIPLEEGLIMIENTPRIYKRRHRIIYHGQLIEVDVFEKDNKGLVIAEIEMEDPDQEILIPDWFSKEITGDDRYSNVKLATKPFNTWNLQTS